MRAMIDEIISAWPIDKPFDARLALGLHKVCDPQVIEKLAIQEFLDHVSSGVRLDPVEFAASFPEVKDSLLVSLVQLLDRIGLDYLQDSALVDYTPVRPLSLTVHSQVYLAEDKTAQGRLVVVKVTADGQREIAAHARVTHQGICRLLTSVPLSDPRRIALIFEYWGSSEATCKSELLQKNQLAAIADALEHCHRIGLAHNDVSLDNIVVHQGIPKLIDFGSSSFVNTPPSNRHIGKLHYVSCETLEELSNEGKLVSASSFLDDCYAFMILAFQLWFRESPIDGPRQNECIDAIFCSHLLKTRREVSSASLSKLHVPPSLQQTFVEWISGKTAPPSPSALIRELKAVTDSYRKLTVIRILIVITLLTCGYFALAYLHPRTSTQSFPSVTPRDFDRAALQDIRDGQVTKALENLIANEREWTRTSLSLVAYCKLMVEGDEHESVRLYERAILMGEDDPTVLSNTGVLLARSKKSSAARAMYQRSIEKQPRSVYVYIHLAALDGFQVNQDVSRALQSAIQMLDHCSHEKTARIVARIILGKVIPKVKSLSKSDLDLFNTLQDRLRTIPLDEEQEDAPIKMQEIPFQSLINQSAFLAGG